MFQSRQILESCCENRPKVVMGGGKEEQTLVKAE